MKDKIWGILGLCISLLLTFIIGIDIGKSRSKVEIVRVPQIEYCVMSWWFRGNTLYWAFDGEWKPENFIQFQLDKNIPPAINQEPIKRIWVMGDQVIVVTKDKYWKLHIGANLDDWYVDDWRPI